MLHTIAVIPRNFRLVSPAKILLVFFALVFYLSFPFTSQHAPILSLEEKEELATASLADLGNAYDQVRLAHLHHAQHGKEFDSVAQAVKLRSPGSLPDGTATFDPVLSTYVTRLRAFADEYFAYAPSHIQAGARDALKEVMRRHHRRNPTFPTKVWSTHPYGLEGVEDGFDLWHRLLPLPLSKSLADQISPITDVDYLRSAREGQSWDVEIADDNGLDQCMSKWTAETISRGIQGAGKWSKLWGQLDKGVLRADLYRYVSMFVEGGIYSDSDSMPISHPYVWGLNAPSGLHPDLQHIITLIDKAVSEQSFKKDRLNPRVSLNTLHNDTTSDDTERNYIPPYDLSRRAPAPVHILPIDPSTILNPDISLIVAVEWDSCIGRNWRFWPQWNLYRIRRAWGEYGYPRDLQMVQNLLVSKPFHPVMLDILATVAELVEHGGVEKLEPLELTGPGPFTDAVLRYLLIQYGVTAEDLRCLKGPIRIGDVIILQEEAWHAPVESITGLLDRVQSLGTDLTRSRHRNGPWRFGLGWKNWRSGGTKVAYHGLTGIWKKQ